MSTGRALLGLKRFVKAARRLPKAVAFSLEPATLTEAAILESQLEMVQTSIRRLDWALPIAATTVLLTVYGYGIPLMPMGAFFVLLILTCLLNEYLLAQKGPESENAIEHAKSRARIISASALLLVAAWCSTVLSMYHAGITANRIFIVLVLACTLGSLSTMLATHTASVTGAMFVMATSLIVVLIRNGFSGRLTLLPMGFIYVIFVINQVRDIHARFTQNRRLMQERETLILGLRQANKESRAAQEQAMTANKAKSEFLANMSHELRTPLNAIIGFSELMREEMFGPLGDRRYGDYSRLIHSAGTHLLGLINDVLDMSKIEAGKLELSTETFDLRSPIGECVELMRERAETAGVTLEEDIPECALLVFADRRAVQQMLLNLLSNAVKFTLAGGRIRVRAGARDSGVWFAVEDNGMGIPEGELPRLGNAFVQVRHHTAVSHTGTGLGLALVRALAERHQGSMRIESEEGVGTIVTVELPTRGAAAAAA